MNKNVVYDPVTNPSHYTEGRKHEPVDVINDWSLNFNFGNALKYISRAGRKDTSKTLEDLKKASWYLNWLVDNDNRSTYVDHASFTSEEVCIDWNIHSRPLQMAVHAIRHQNEYAAYIALEWYIQDYINSCCKVNKEI